MNTMKHDFGKIDKDGDLVIVGAMNTKKRYVYCPKQENSRECGDWCPFFGEPEPLKQDGQYHPATLQICEVIYEFRDFTDQRNETVKQIWGDPS
jgi:hypothetical protein